MERSADISACGHYRYSLSRIWDPTLPYVAFIGLNPSTADAVQDDPTLNRCIQYAKDWGYGGVWMINLFAFRATSPIDMMTADDPIGPNNDDILWTICNDAGLVVAAWGNYGGFNSRSTHIRKIIGSLKCLKINKSGEPAHPLYQPRHAKLVSL